MPTMRPASHHGGGEDLPWRILLVHGAGSTATTAQALFEPLLAASIRGSWWVESLEDRTGDVEQVARQVSEWLALSHDTTARRMIAGISLGAHAAILGCALPGSRTSADCVIAALPAWMGAPDETAALTEAAGLDIAANGIPRTLDRIAAEAPQDRAWVVQALARDWPVYTEPGLADALRTAACGGAPAESDLRTCARPVLILAIDDDPLHPAAVARTWARHLPDATVARISPDSDTGFASPEAVTALASMVERVADEGGLRIR